MKYTSVIRRPIVTEKSTLLKEGRPVYVFEVAKKATKEDVKASVESLFGVKVKAVRTLIQRGKVKRFGSAMGRTAPFKKAYVTLTEGAIQLFEGV